jgi:hypothetical protein
MAEGPKPPRWKRMWRKYGLRAVMGVVILAGAAGGFWKINRDLREVRSRQQNIEQLLKEKDSGRGGISHNAIDIELTEELASMIPDAKEVVEKVSPEDEKEELEKRLIKAWELLQDSKKQPANDPLDCRRLHTAMIEIRGKVDSILHLGLEGSGRRASKVSLIAVPLARIQSKSGHGTVIALKESQAHPAAPGRTDKVIEAAGNIMDVLDAVRRSLALL